MNWVLLNYFIKIKPFIILTFSSNPDGHIENNFTCHIQLLQTSCSFLKTPITRIGTLKTIFLGKNLLQSCYLREAFGNFLSFPLTYVFQLITSFPYFKSVSVFYVSSPMTDNNGFGYRMQRKKCAEAFSCSLSSIQSREQVFWIVVVLFQKERHPHFL